MSPTPFPQLHKQQFMNLTTYRKTGQPVVTTVWFAQVDDRLYGTSQPQTGKIKRMRNNPQVLVAPSNYTGKELSAAIFGLARILPPSEAKVARQALNKKYGIQIKFLNFYVKIRHIQEIFWEITPAQEQTA
jgi:PPOX class probable F420-dependent enzyme